MKAAKLESRLDALQTTFSDKNRMRRSATVRAVRELPGSYDGLCRDHQLPVE
jgi:hypothetical protein